MLIRRNLRRINPKTKRVRIKRREKRVNNQKKKNMWKMNELSMN